MSDINSFIDEQVKSNDVMLFMKGTPDFPQCGFSGQVVQILNYLGVDYNSANVLENEDLRQGIKMNMLTSAVAEHLPKIDDADTGNDIAKLEGHYDDSEIVRGG